MNVLGVQLPKRDLLAIIVVAVLVTFGATNLPFLGEILGAGIYVFFIIGLGTFWSREGRLDSLRGKKGAV